MLELTEEISRSLDQAANTPSINQQLFDNLKAVVECGLLASFDDQVEILIKAQALVRQIEGNRNVPNPPA